MIPTRTTQPYRKGQRELTPALLAMLQGRPSYLPNPADVNRRRQRLAALIKSLHR